MQEKIENIIDKDIEILEHLKEYLQLKIDSGYHKIIYNDLGYDEKIIDCINSIENLIENNKEKEEDLKLHERTSFEFQEENIKLKTDLKIYKKQVKMANKSITGYIKKVKKLNKVIDKMAEHIVNSAVVDDTVCCLKVGCEDKECNYKEMLKCTKQYFRGDTKWIK